MRFAQNMGPGLAMMHPIVAHDSLHPVTLAYALKQDLLQEKRCARTSWAASFGATLLVHSEALKETLFLQLVDQAAKIVMGIVLQR